MSYQQQTEVNLLTKMLSLLENNIVIDVGAEHGSLLQSFLDQGSSAIYAFEPYPPNIAVLRAKFGHSEQVHISEIALGNRDELVDLYIAQDKTGLAPEAYHSLRKIEDTATIHWQGKIAVTCRTLGSLVAEGKIPAEVGILKIDTEGNDFNVLQGMDTLSSALVMIECWDDLPETVGKCPFRLEEVCAYMRERNYTHFAVIKRKDEFESIQIDSAEISSGDWGNAIFIHERVFLRVFPLLIEAVNAAQQQLTKQAFAFRNECHKRLKVIEELSQHIDYLKASKSARR